ncbi:MAG: DUF6361 family protein [Bryobacterales bacterium]|nr:DUF6361 family protein [Bryobacterales bacterium]
MPFTLSWVDHDQQARDRAEKVLALLGEREARDELGLGPIRDSLSDLLFPGTSTIQTRLRYFLIVPWVYRTLEDEGIADDEVWTKGRDLELKVSEHLRATSEAGVFGRRAGRRLRRLPSSVYWLGLGTWGLRHDSAGQNGASRWHRGLPKRPSGFPQIDTLDLTAAEAEYLQDRVAQSVPDSLLAHLFRLARPAECRFAWQHPGYAEFRESHRAALEHARLFSEVIYGAPLLYNLLLARRAQREDKITEYRKELETWALDLDRSALDNWSVMDFWSTVCRRRRINPGARDFVDGWIDLARTSALDVERHGIPADDSPPARLVRMREKTLKRERSRFLNRRLLDQWGGAAGVYRMDYRWNNVRNYVREVAAGLGQE